MKTMETVVVAVCLGALGATLAACDSTQDLGGGSTEGGGDGQGGSTSTATAGPGTGPTTVGSTATSVSASSGDTTSQGGGSTTGPGTTSSSGSGGGGGSAGAPPDNPPPARLPAVDTRAVAAADPGSTLPEGWMHGGLLQVYVRAYQDSNGDGIGDLRGLIQRLPYIQQLGVAGLWLMPITRSQDLSLIHISEPTRPY